MKTSQEKEDHRQRTNAIVNQLADEYGSWNAHPGFGRNVALGEYILEITEDDGTHDTWLMVARESFLKWKMDQGTDTGPTPPRVRVG